MKKFRYTILLIICVIVTITSKTAFAESNLLTPEENLWLKSRNNTIVVYPEQNFPPYSYENSSGTPQGLSIDYIQLITEKLGIKIQFLPARPLSQILDDVQRTKKGDVITSLADTTEREEYLYFTHNYASIPAVIVVRKDLNKGNDLTLNDLSGKKVAIGSKYAVEQFVRTMNPRIIIEGVVDDESGLQQVVLGEVDAAIIDMGSLSHYLSKQVLNSVKVVGNTGFEYNLAFAVPKDKEILQSILDKGLAQVSDHERQLFSEKWMSVGVQDQISNPFLSYVAGNYIAIILYGVLCFIIIVLIVFLRNKAIKSRIGQRRKRDSISELKDEIVELENANTVLMDDMAEIKNLEKDIKEKIKDIEK